jgi:hypothetical protein
MDTDSVSGSSLVPEERLEPEPLEEAGSDSGFLA